MNEKIQPTATKNARTEKCLKENLRTNSSDEKIEDGNPPDEKRSWNRRAAMSHARVVGVGGLTENVFEILR